MPYIAPVDKLINCDIITKWPLPKTSKEIRTFLGKTGYFRRFIKNYAKVAEPLQKYLSGQNHPDLGILRNNNLELSQEAKDAFGKLKDALTQSPILAMPDFSINSNSFVVDTDFSCTAIGAVLLQTQDSAERVIAYGSRKLLPRESNYASTKGELLAIVYFLKLWN